MYFRIRGRRCPCPQEHAWRGVGEHWQGTANPACPDTRIVNTVDRAWGGSSIACQAKATCWQLDVFIDCLATKPDQAERMHLMSATRQAALAR